MSLSKSQESNNSDVHPPNSNLNVAIAGASSGLLTRAIAQPLDVVKIKFQLQTEPISKRFEQSKYRGNIQALKLIFAEEGIRGLWRAHLAAQLLSISYGLVQFQVYELTKVKARKLIFSKNVDVNKSVFLNFLCGGTAGCTATIISFPFDIIRTRLVAQGNNKYYNGIFHGLITMYRKEGILSYWKGLSPALIVAGPFIGFQFAFYELFKNIISKVNLFGMRKDGTDTSPLGKLVAGSLSGICSKFLSYPFDLARKRMQMQSFQYARVGFGANFWCTNLITCLITTLRNERFLGMYKGLSPTLLKSAFNTALHFMFYEETLRYLNKSV